MEDNTIYSYKLYYWNGKYTKYNRYIISKDISIFNHYFHICLNPSILSKWYFTSSASNLHDIFFIINLNPHLDYLISLTFIIL